MLDQQPAHRGVISGAHHRQGRGPQGGDRDRPGIVRIALRGLARCPTPAPVTPTSPARSAPSPRRRRAAGRADSPSHRPTPPPTSVARHRQPTPAAGSPDDAPARTLIRRSSCSPRSSIVAVCDPLCGSTPIITSIVGSSCLRLGTVAGTPDSKDWHVPLVSHTTARPRQADTSLDSQKMIGRQFESDPAGASRRYENPRDAYDYSIRQFWRGGELLGWAWLSCRGARRCGGGDRGGCRLRGQWGRPAGVQGSRGRAPCHRDGPDVDHDPGSRDPRTPHLGHRPVV